MSKRVMILFAIGFLCIVASFFLMKHELTEDPGTEDLAAEDLTEETETEKPAANVQEKTDTSAGDK